MNAELKSWPERIWLQHGFEYLPEFEVAYHTNTEITWCQDSVEEHNIEYVRADLAQPVSAGLTDAEIDRLLSARIPGGSAARDWFLPHESERGLENVRDVVRALLSAAQRDSQDRGYSSQHARNWVTFAAGIFRIGRWKPDYSSARTQQNRVARNADAPSSAFQPSAFGTAKALPKPASINRRLAILRRVANLAYDEWHWLDRPIAVRLLPEHNKRHEYLSQDEIELLSAACREPVNHWVMVAAYSGIRRGEMLRVNAKSIRGDNLFLGLTKNGKPILLPIVPKFKEALNAWIAADKPDPRTMHKYFKSGAKKIGKPDLRPHDLRHTTASLILNAGHDLSTVAEVLNCTIQNAQRYAHLSIQNKRKAMLNISKPKKTGVKLAVNIKTG
jgi:integrase